MYRRRFPAAGGWQHAARILLPTLFKTTLWASLAAGGAGAWAQPADGAAEAGPPTLASAFEAAWSRQPEAQALTARREAVAAQQQAAQAWTPEPPVLEMATKTDRFHRNLGNRELEVGMAIPLWLPGERGRGQTLADAEARALESRTLAARLRVAASVRDAWWAWQRSRAEWQAAQGQLDSARRIAADVSTRLKAGDLARADQHQAEGAVASAEAAWSQARGELAAAAQQLRALTALLPPLGPAAPADVLAEPWPDAGLLPERSAGPQAESHPELQELRDRAAVAQGTAALAASQTRANPELTFGITRERGSSAEAHQQAFTVGLRFPFGGGARQDARLAAARADVTELNAQVALERDRLAAGREAAQARTDAARALLTAAERRAQLAAESRSFFEKSFRLGETDLPTRLRIEAEAAEADRQAARARIELSAAVSAWRQALGLLPQ